MTPQAIREVIVGGQTVVRDGALTKLSWDDVVDGMLDVTAGWPRDR